MGIKKRRFTWLDGLCVVLVLAALAGAGLFFTLRRGTGAGAEIKNYEITMRFTQETTDPYDFYQVGDTMYFMNRTDVLGTVTSLRSMDRLIEEYDEAMGQYYTIVDQRRQTIEMKVLAQGVLSNGRFEVSEEQLYIGKTFYPQSDITRSIMVIWDIKEAAE